jgi:hypothetical protein
MVNRRIFFSRGFLAAVAFFVAALANPLGQRAEAASFSLSGSLNVARYSHTATLLPSGKVLVTGGIGPSNSISGSAELYDPVAGTWSLAGTMAVARYSHTATLLTNGNVLVAGGRGAAGEVATVELYDPGSGIWSTTGLLNVGRRSHTATLLLDGRVLVAGGYGSSGDILNGEVYDPGTRTWSLTGPLTTSRVGHAAALLPAGTVLVAGGYGRIGAEVYDPALGTWTAISPMSFVRSEFPATLVGAGKVLVSGGFATSDYNASAEVYDPVSGNWSLTGSMATARSEHTATTLPNGTVLVTGGDGDSGFLASAESYNPLTGTWTTYGNLNVARDSHTATLLSDGTVLVAGGYNGASISTTERSSQQACDLTVTGTNDSGPGSLRQAILNANACGGGTISLSNVIGTITLSSELPVVSANTSIVGPGTNLLTISGGDSLRVFSFGAGTTSYLAAVTITRGAAAFGGGVYNAGALTMQTCAVLDCNSGTVGGGICNSNVLVIDHCTVSSCGSVNAAPRSGGGIYNAGSLVVGSSAMVDCHASRQGGAVFNSGNLVVSNTMFLCCGDNYQAGGLGGGVYNTASAIITSCTISNCYGNQGGGGLYSESSCRITNVDFLGCGSYGALSLSGSAVLSDCTVAGSSGVYMGAINNYGSALLIRCTIANNRSDNGVYNRGGELSLCNCTLSSNGWCCGTQPTGAIRNTGAAILHLDHCTVSSNIGYGVLSQGGVLDAKNTIISSNGSGTNDCVGPLTSRGYNLIQSTNGSIISGDVTGNIYGLDPVLGPLQDNGGPTWTRAVLPGSPAIDQGTADGARTDQRGVSRPYDVAMIPNAVDGSDIGAFESTVDLAAPAILVQPISQTAPACGGASFSVLASGTPALKYQWRFNGEPLAGATASTFVRSNLRATDAGSYSVTVSNIFGSVISSNALLTVSPVALPSITVQPTNQSVAAWVGTVSFGVEATGTALWYQWLFESTPIVGANAPLLTLSNVPPSQAGHYAVLVTNWCGTATSSSALLTVLGSPPLVTFDPTNQIVAAWDTARFSVGANGTAPLSFQWLHAGVPITGATSSSLVLSNVQPAQAGNYSVLVSNPYGSVASSDALLTVLTFPPSILTQPTNQVAAAGSNTTFEVTAAGTAPLSYQWLHAGVAITGATSSVYVISNIQPAQAGVYSVVVSNAYGSTTSDDVNLTIFTVIITSQPIRYRAVLPGWTNTFTVGAVGSAPLNYQWHRNGTNVPGATAASLTLTNIQQADAGTYDVRIANSYGSTNSDAAVLFVVFPNSNSVKYVNASNATPAAPFSTWGTAAVNVQDAIMFANDADTVLVHRGLYKEHVDFRGKAIVLSSVDGPNVTTLDGDRSGSVVTFSGGEGTNSILHGFTIMNGYARRGGGVYSTNATPVISNCVIVGNSTSPGISTTETRADRLGGDGGGIYSSPGSFLLIIDCAISNNTTGAGAGGPLLFNGYVSGNGGNGGGIWCESATIVRSVISGNRSGNGAGGYGVASAGGDGGGVYADSVTILNSVIDGNATGDSVFSTSNSDGGGNGGRGGGVFVSGSGVIEGCTISRNSTGAGARALEWSGGSGGDGGGVYAGGGSLNLRGCSFSENRTGAGAFGEDSRGGKGGSGGGLYIAGSADASGCMFLNNTTGNGGGDANWLGIGSSGGGGKGGAVFCFSGTFSNCVFRGNATGRGGSGSGYGTRGLVHHPTGGGAGGDGGAICALGASTLTSCLLVSNSTGPGGAGSTDGNGGNGANGGSGSGCWVQGGTIANCTFWGNTLGAGGEAVPGYVSGSDGIGGGLSSQGGTVVNCILWGDGAPEIGGTGLSVSYCDLAAGAGQPWFDPATCLEADPQFANALLGDWHLGIGSPCINTGTNQPWVNGAVDLDGNPRVSCGVVDLGAFESVIVPPDVVQQPEDAILAQGQTASFTAVASGSSPLSYQWRFNGSDLIEGGRFLGVNSNRLAIAHCQSSDAGNYDVVVSNACGAATSRTATLTVLQPPIITVPPQSRAGAPSGLASFSVLAQGLAPLRYQWRRNGADLLDRTNKILVLANLQPADFADYSVLVTNVDGAVLSESARLFLAASPRVGSLNFNVATFTLVFSTEIGPDYMIEYKDRLSDSSWRLLTIVAGTGVPITITDNGLTNAMRFYRIHVQ